MFLRWWQQRRSKQLAGLDISADFLKLLLIDTSKTPFEVESFSISPAAPGAIVKDEIKNPDAVSAALKETFRKARLQNCDIVLALPRSLVITKNITLDKRLTSDEIEARAWLEASRLYPDLVGEIYLDFTEIGTSVQDAMQVEYNLVACRKEQLAPYLDVLKQAGLTAKIVDVNSFALERALAQLSQSHAESETIALFNLDLTLSTFIVVHEHKMIYAHDHPFDAHLFMQRAQDYFKNNAEATLEDPAYLSIFTESLSAHLRHSLHFFYSSRPNITIQKIYIAGDCARIPDLALYVQKEIGIEVVVANPFINMTISPKIDQEKLKLYSPALTLCCGLALSKSMQG